MSAPEYEGARGSDSLDSTVRRNVLACVESTFVVGIAPVGVVVVVGAALE